MVQKQIWGIKSDRALYFGLDLFQRRDMLSYTCKIAT